MLFCQLIAVDVKIAIYFFEWTILIFETNEEWDLTNILFYFFSTQNMPAALLFRVTKCIPYCFNKHTFVFLRTFLFCILPKGEEFDLLCFILYIFSDITIF